MVGCSTGTAGNRYVVFLSSISNASASQAGLILFIKQTHSQTKQMYF